MPFLHSKIPQRSGSISHQESIKTQLQAPIKPNGMPHLITQKLLTPLTPLSTPPIYHTSKADDQITLQHGIYHPTYSTATPIQRILSFLSKSSLLTVRLVSHASYAMVTAKAPCIFSNLNLTFPIPTSHSKSLQHAANNCLYLTIRFQSLTQPNTTTILPSFPDLIHLHIISSTNPTSAFDQLLAFHLALQAAYVPNLVHLAINDLSVDGILALRWGSFTSFGASNPQSTTVWRRLKKLAVTVIPWWDADPYSSKRTTEEARDADHTGMKVLHDWLHTFATRGSLETLKFGWKDVDGPNPLLLDDFVAQGRENRWFSAPKIKWDGLRKIWLRGIHVDVKDVRLIKKRMERLERLMVQVGREAQRVKGKNVRVEGKIWFEAWLGEESGREDIRDAIALRNYDRLRDEAERVVGKELKSEAREDDMSVFTVPMILDVTSI